MVCKRHAGQAGEKEARSKTGTCGAEAWISSRQKDIRVGAVSMTLNSPDLTVCQLSDFAGSNLCRLIFRISVSSSLKWGS